MEKYLGLLAEVLNTEDKKLLQASQKNWEFFVDVNFQLEHNVVGQASGYGTMMGDISRANYYDRHRERTLFLEMLYKNAQEESYQSWPWDNDN